MIALVVIYCKNVGLCLSNTINRHIPQKLKTAKVIPIFKKEEETLTKNY